MFRQSAELAGLSTATAKMVCNFHIFPIHNPYHIVSAIWHIKPALLWVMGKRDLPCGSGSQCLWSHENLVNVGAVELKDLDSVVWSIRHVKPVVMRNDNAMHRRTEIITWAFRRVVGAWICVIGCIPVRTPVAQMLARVGVKDDYATILIAVCHIKFIAIRVHHHIGRAAEHSFVRSWSRDEFNGVRVNLQYYYGTSD